MRRTTTLTDTTARIGFASKALAIGLFLGAGTALWIGGSTAGQLALGTVVATPVAAAIYVGLVTLATRIGREPPSTTDSPRRQPLAADGGDSP